MLLSRSEVISAGVFQKWVWSLEVKICSHSSQLHLEEKPLVTAWCVAFTACAHVHTHTRANPFVYLPALMLTVLRETVFVLTLSMLPSCVSDLHLITEKSQPTFVWAASPGRFVKRCNIVWGDTVPTWAEVLVGCLYKLISSCWFWTQTNSPLLSHSPPGRQLFPHLSPFSFHHISFWIQRWRICTFVCGRVEVVCWS